MNNVDAIMAALSWVLVDTYSGLIINLVKLGRFVKGLKVAGLSRFSESVETL